MKFAKYPPPVRCPPGWAVDFCERRREREILCKMFPLGHRRGKTSGPFPARFGLKNAQSGGDGVFFPLPTIPTVFPHSCLRWKGRNSSPRHSRPEPFPFEGEKVTFSTEVATVSCTPSFSLTSHCIVGRTHLGPKIVEMLATPRVSSFLNSEKSKFGEIRTYYKNFFG